MDSPQPTQSRNSPHPLPQGTQPATAAQFPSATANSTPASSPGLFSPTASRLNMAHQQQPASEGATPALGPVTSSSPYLHPLQTRKVRETYTANVDRDYTTGRKHINQYEVMEEIGRGQHGKVKLARNTETGENVAIKIIPRYSKKRRLGKVTAEDPQRNTKREIAILKKIRHPNVVALLEVIDDPELKKIYMVLEHVEHGEVTWRKKGLPRICDLERRMFEKEARGESTAEELAIAQFMRRQYAVKELKRSKAAQLQNSSGDYWSLEYGPVDEDDSIPSLPGSRTASQAPSRTQSARSLSKIPMAHAAELELARNAADYDAELSLALRHNFGSSPLEGTMYGAYADENAAFLRARSPSMADSIISHMSSVDFASPPHDPFVDDFSYVPCFTFDNARLAFRDTVLGLEYLHYNGVVHRDIKPANLLWTKDFRVKISDFGVSYFGRPIRDGEPDDVVLESEALDFDDDRELAKTVGTPAFFAPELCYTDIDKEPPKVSEQIDVWSLGVTLYCIIFARIPFLAEDEFSMFRKIATEDVHIPRRRLRPVFPFTDPSKVSLYKRVNSEPYRDDDDPSYEEIDAELHGLLRRMLTRNPDDRIRLRDVKTHPWVVRGIDDINSWLDETDPSRKMAGRQIEVNEKEIGRAVVPLTFLERARSAVKKAVGKVIHPRGDHRDHSTRRRANSSVASSAGDSGSNPPSAYPFDIRRKSIRGDDYFATVTQMPSEHPLSQSVTASPLEQPHGFTPLLSSSLGRKPSRHVGDLRSESPDIGGMQFGTFRKSLTRHSHARSIGSSFLSLTPDLQESRTLPPSPGVFGEMDDIIRPSNRTGREALMSSDDSSRARSMDRAGLVFPNADKHAQAKVALNIAAVPGELQQPPRSPRHIRSIDHFGNIDRVPQPPPSLISRLPLSAYQHVHPKSDTNIAEKLRPSLDQDERPLTAHRIDVTATKADTQTPATVSEALSDAGLPAQAVGQRDGLKQRLSIRTAVDLCPADVPCPPSPGDEVQSQEPLPPSREETMSTAVSSSVTSFGAIATPMTSPSVVASPTCHTKVTHSRDKVDSMPAFQSDPSLPALMSGASSVSADVEGDFLGNPGTVDGSSLIATTESLTPPAPIKETLAEFPLEQSDADSSDAIAVRLDAATAPEVNIAQTASHRPSPNPANTTSKTGQNVDEDSDSDDGIIMIRSRKKTPARSPPPPLQHQYVPTGSLAMAARRRDTNTSIGSTETAKKIDVHGEVHVERGV